jgi:hypothetical protein
MLCHILIASRKAYQNITKVDLSPTQSSHFWLWVDSLLHLLSYCWVISKEINPMQAKEEASTLCGMLECSLSLPTSLEQIGSCQSPWDLFVHLYSPRVWAPPKLWDEAGNCLLQ